MTTTFIDLLYTDEDIPPADTIVTANSAMGIFVNKNVPVTVSDTGDLTSFSATLFNNYNGFQSNGDFAINDVLDPSFLVIEPDVTISSLDMIRIGQIVIINTIVISKGGAGVDDGDLLFTLYPTSTSPRKLTFIPETTVRFVGNELSPATPPTNIVLTFEALTGEVFYNGPSASLDSFAISGTYIASEN